MPLLFEQFNFSTPTQDVVYLPFEALHGGNWDSIYKKRPEQSGQDSVLVNPGLEVLTCTQAKS